MMGMHHMAMIMVKARISGTRYGQAKGVHTSEETHPTITTERYNNPRGDFFPSTG